MLDPGAEARFLRYRPDFTGPATNFNEIGWRMAMDKDLRALGKASFTRNGD